MTDVRKVSP